MTILTNVTNLIIEIDVKTITNMTNAHSVTSVTKTDKFNTI